VRSQQFALGHDPTPHLTCDILTQAQLIRARTGEGRKRARARGVKFGRPPKLNAHQRKEAIARMRNGETQADSARTYGVDATTIGRLDCAPAYWGAYVTH
jgi:DNA invertase Pin-like site-specific DNA recombinase